MSGATSDFLIFLGNIDSAGVVKWLYHLDVAPHRHPVQSQSDLARKQTDKT